MHYLQSLELLQSLQSLYTTSHYRQWLYTTCHILNTSTRGVILNTSTQAHVNTSTMLIQDRAARCILSNQSTPCFSEMLAVWVVGVSLLCVAVCCSVLQCVAMCCSVLQCAAVCYSVLQCAARVLQCVDVCCGMGCGCRLAVADVQWHTRTHTQELTHWDVSFIHVELHNGIYDQLYIYIHIYIYMYLSIFHIWISIYMCVCICIYIYIYI